MEANTLEKPIFTNRQLYMLVWPLIVEQLLNVLVGMVDVVMVASLGEAAVSGVSLVDALNQLLLHFLTALATGGAVVSSQFIGMQNYEKAKQTAGQLILMAVSITLLVCAGFLLSGTHLLRLIFGQVEEDVMDNAYTYYLITSCSFPFLALYNASAALFRAQGNSKISMKTSLLMNGMNVVGNAICIFGLKMGVAGVAVPTLIARATASFVLFSLLQRGGGDLRIESIRDFIPNGTIIGRILNIGIPGGIEQSIFQLGKLMLQSLVATLGTAAIAGYAVAGNLVMFLYLPGNSLGLALTTVVGQCVGAREPEQALYYKRKFVQLDYAFLAVLSVVMGLGRYFWVGIYNLSPEAAEIAAGLVLSHSIAMLIWPPAFLAPNALRAANDARFTMIVSIACMWTFRVALAYLFVKGMGRDIQYVWYAMYIDWAFRIVVYGLRFRGYVDRIKALKI